MNQFLVCLFWTLFLSLTAIEPLHDIRGQISVSNDPGWQVRTTVSANFGEYFGFVQQNGSFVIPSVKAG